jgi:hypothetical protein
LPSADQKLRERNHVITCDPFYERVASFELSKQTQGGGYAIKILLFIFCLTKKSKKGVRNVFF